LIQTDLRRFVVLTLLLINSGLPATAQEAAASLARAVDAHYNKLKSFKAAFTEIYTGPGISRNETGVLWLKKPGRMRWEYHQPREKLFLTDGQTAYFYVPGESQARKTAVKNIDDIRSPLRYLLGKARLEKELDGLSLAPDVAALQPGNMVLRGVPKDMKDRVSSLLMEVSPLGQIFRIVIYETDGSSTDFRFSGFEENVPVQDSLFHFTPPPGVEMIQQDHPAAQ
jgi:outer membrane lipoprotein carrier protein